MTTLENSYCVPKGEEWDIFGLIPLTGHKVMWLGGEPSLVSGTFNDRTEIPVSHFIDLLHDRIVPWRLEEVGFKPWPNSNTPASMLWENEAQYTIEVIVESVYVNSASFNITTFTDLLTLIRMLTPPSNN